MRRFPGHIVAYQVDAALLRRQITHDGLQKRTLPHAVFAQKGDDLAVADREVYITDDDGLTITTTDAIDAEDGCTIIHFPSPPHHDPSRHKFLGRVLSQRPPSPNRREQFDLGVEQ